MSDYTAYLKRLCILWVQAGRFMTIDIAHEPDIGYLFYPSEQPNHPGHPRLDVIIPAKPTHRHFDPQTAEYLTVSSSETIQHTHLHHPWTMEKQMRVITGRIFITDRKQKRVEAFSFGGHLEIGGDDTRTVCALESPAPIFPLFTIYDLSTWFVSEVEVLMAQRRAHWDPKQPHLFDKRLAAASPFLLYLSCLQAIQDRFKKNPQAYDKLTRQGVHFVTNEIQQLQNNPAFPLSIPPVAELL
jgi:hypothetical protein